MCVRHVSLTVTKYFMRSNLRKKGHVLVSSLKVSGQRNKRKRKGNISDPGHVRGEGLM